MIYAYFHAVIAIARDPVFDEDVQEFHPRMKALRHERRDEEELEDVELVQASGRLNKSSLAPYINRERGTRGGGPHLVRGFSGHQAGTLPNGPRGYRGRGAFRGQLRGQPRAHLRDGRY
jgi:hypothetical protein